MIDLVLKMVGEDSPVGYALILLAGLYFAFLATGNVRRTLRDLRGHYRDLELRKLRLEVLKLEHEMRALGIDVAQVDAPEATKDEPPPAAPPRHVSTAGRVTRMGTGILLLLFGLFLCFAAFGGYLEGDNWAATAILAFGLALVTAGYRMVMGHTR